jgi:hypothetical protein
MKDKTTVEPNHRGLRHKLNLETAKLSWPELQRHFARGVVIVVHPTLDLVEASATLAEDNNDRAQSWINAGQLGRATEDQAHRWNESNQKFWAVVVAPWVLVQEIPAGQ